MRDDDETSMPSLEDGSILEEAEDGDAREPSSDSGSEPQYTHVPEWVSEFRRLYVEPKPRTEVREKGWRQRLGRSSAHDRSAATDAAASAFGGTAAAIAHDASVGGAGVSGDAPGAAPIGSAASSSGSDAEEVPQAPRSLADLAAEAETPNDVWNGQTPTTVGPDGAEPSASPDSGDDTGSGLGSLEWAADGGVDDEDARHRADDPGPNGFASPPGSSEAGGGGTSLAARLAPWSRTVGPTAPSPEPLPEGGLDEEPAVAAAGSPDEVGDPDAAFDEPSAGPVDAVEPLVESGGWAGRAPEDERAESEDGRPAGPALGAVELEEPGRGAWGVDELPAVPLEEPVARADESADAAPSEPSEGSDEQPVDQEDGMAGSGTSDSSAGWTSAVEEAEADDPAVAEWAEPLPDVEEAEADVPAVAGGSMARADEVTDARATQPGAGTPVLAPAVDADVTEAGPGPHVEPPDDVTVPSVQDGSSRQVDEAPPAPEPWVTAPLPAQWTPPDPGRHSYLDEIIPPIDQLGWGDASDGSVTRPPRRRRPPVEPEEPVDDAEAPQSRAEARAAAREVEAVHRGKRRRVLVALVAVLLVVAVLALWWMTRSKGPVAAYGSPRMVSTTVVASGTAGPSTAEVGRF